MFIYSHFNSTIIIEKMRLHLSRSKIILSIYKYIKKTMIFSQKSTKYLTDIPGSDATLPFSQGNDWAR